MVFLCLKLKAVAAYLHVEKIKQMEGRQAQYTRSLKAPCHGDEPTRSWSARGTSANLVIGSKTSRDLSPFLTSCKPFFAHARSQRMGFDDYGIRGRFLRAKMSNEKKSILVCPPPQVQKESDLEKEARFLANPFSSFPIFYLTKLNEPTCK